jgi:hypothetical protein
MDRVRWFALLFSALVAGPGCVSVDGGAVEVSWVVEAKDGTRIIADCGCTCPPVAKIRLALVPAGGGSDVCAGRTSCAFSCNLQTGATRFDIKPGTYAMSLVPVGADGNDITTGEVGTCSLGALPAPQVRDVIKGRVTQLDAMFVQTDCAAECGGSDTTRVCTK